MLMRRYSYRSKTLVSVLCAALLAVPLTLMAACMSPALKSFGLYSEYAILPANSSDGADVKWATYLKTHFQKRATDRDCVIATPAQDDSQLQVTVDLNPRLATDYQVGVADHALNLSARNTEAMLWLLYQFMSAAARADSRLAVSDLPPAVLSCQRDTAGTFAFEYRGIYSPSNADADLMPILGVHNVDFDWGLWGHNINKVFGGNVPDKARALVGGHRSDSQWCFSSDELYRAYERYIIDNYGDGTADAPTRFSVMPNDNDEVCQCPDCRAAGNTPTSATPAVTRMVKRLSRRFPHQLFFTSAYATTQMPPTHRLPANVGVLVSAMDLPLVADEDDKAAAAKTAKAKARFGQTIQAWQRSTDRVYVWDYMRNFDDYLTPYPCLHALQGRLRYYQQLGIRGVFFNGSGYDYASFDDVQTYVLAQLLLNPEADVDAGIHAYLAATYPVTGQLLENYYTSLEAAAAGHVLPWYGGMADMVAAGVDPTALNRFANQLEVASKKADVTERKKINALLTALAYPRLEALRQKAERPADATVAQLTSLLAAHTAFKDMANYREAQGDIDSYLSQWRLSYPWPSNSGRRPLLGLRCLEGGAEGQSVEVLADGRQGFTTDYHTGWYITSAPQLCLQGQGFQRASVQLSLSFLHAPVWHIYLPSEVSVWQGDTCCGRATVPAATDGRARVTLPAAGLVPLKPIEIRIKQNNQAKGRVTLACDEIEVM